MPRFFAAFLAAFLCLTPAWAEKAPDVSPFVVFVVVCETQRAEGALPSCNAFTGVASSRAECEAASMSAVYQFTHQNGDSHDVVLVECLPFDVPAAESAL